MIRDDKLNKRKLAVYTSSLIPVFQLSNMLVAITEQSPTLTLLYTFKEGYRKFVLSSS